MNENNIAIDKANEILFWDRWLEGNGKAYEGSRRLSNRFTFMIGDKKKVLIADLGAGPVCLIGDSRRDVSIKVITSDLLADEYRNLLKKHNLNPHTLVEKQDMTKLTYKDNSFDIVHCANALDHSQNPYQALKEMMRICKPGGYVYLRHIAHEGQRHQYRNMHKWNIDKTEGNDCIFWDSQEGTETNAFLLSDIYPGFTTTIEMLAKGAIVTSYVQKI